MGAAIAGQVQITSQYVDQGTTAGVSIKTPVVISDTTLAAPAASIDLTAIPTGYKWMNIDLKCNTSDAGACAVSLRYNNDGGANYAYNHGGIAATGQTQALVAYASGTGLPPAVNHIILFNTTAAEGKAAGGTESFGTALASFTYATWHNWTGVAEISRIALTPGAGNFTAGTRITITGLK